MVSATLSANNCMISGRATRQRASIRYGQCSFSSSCGSASLSTDKMMCSDTSCRKRNFDGRFMSLKLIYTECLCDEECRNRIHIFNKKVCIGENSQ